MDEYLVCDGNTNERDANDVKAAKDTTERRSYKK